MLPKRHRYHSRRDLSRVYQRGRTARSAYVAIRAYVRPDGRSEPRSAVVVSKKISKSAVVRNRIRRRVYEVLRGYWPQLKPGTDLVVTVFDARAATVPADQLRRLVAAALGSAHVLVAEESKPTTEAPKKA